MGSEILRISIPSSEKKIKIEQFDPARISFIDEWDISLNLYSRLISFTKNSEVVSGLAKKFYWKDDAAHFEIRDDFRTADGHKITPEDVAYSLKRLMLLSTNTHGKLDNILCDAGKLKDINSSCEGISFNENEVIIKAKKQDQFFFTTLTASDFSIIPRKSIDLKTLKIVDYKNTSGLYYFAGYNKSDNIILKINPKHWNYSKNIPQEVEIIPDVFGQQDNGESVAEKFLKGTIDATSKSGTMRQIDFEELTKKLAAKNVKYDYHNTHPIMLMFLKFSSVGFSLDQKLKFAVLQDVQNLLKNSAPLLKQESMEATSYIFQPNAHGCLTGQQQKEYQAAIATAIDKSIPKQTINVGVVENSKDFYAKILKDGYFKYNIVAYPSQDDYKTADKKSASYPHLFAGNQDILFEEDINLLSFAFSSSDIFSLKGDDADKWLSIFRNESDKKHRMEMIQKLHFDSLIKNTSIIPLFTGSQQALAINGWKLQFSTYTADTPFWHIEREN